LKEKKRERDRMPGEKEVENLITENNELLATKNALSIVKDDLIAKVDELQSELTISRDDVQQLTSTKKKLMTRVGTLEEEFKKAKSELEECKQKLSQLKEDDEEGIPMVQRKRFTRVEMAKVLMERNQYKERLVELQEAIRWTELIRASKTEGEKKSPIWRFSGRNFSSFSNLFNTSTWTQTTTKDSPTKSEGPGVSFLNSSHHEEAVEAIPTPTTS